MVILKVRSSPCVEWECCCARLPHPSHAQPLCAARLAVLNIAQLMFNSAQGGLWSQHSPSSFPG